MNWKYQFDQKFSLPDRVLLPTKKMRYYNRFWVTPKPSAVKKFIETQIIEKILKEIDQEKWDESGKGDYLINWTEARQKLINKWQ